MGEALVRALMVVDSRVLTSGLRSAELTAFWHCVPLLQVLQKGFLEGYWGFFKQNV